MTTVLIWALLLLVAPTRTFSPPAGADETRAGMCAEYSGLAQGFCVALCEARECDLRPSDDERCAILRRGFERASGGVRAPC